MFGALYVPDGSFCELLDIAASFSPRMVVEGVTPEAREVTLDLSGLSRLFGDAHAIGEELLRTAIERGAAARVAIAGTRTAARLLVHANPGLTVVTSDREAAAVAVLPLDLLTVVCEASAAPSMADAVVTVKRWGLRTLGELAALPADDVAARLGTKGVDCQRLARGEDSRPFVPHVPEERFEQALDLEWPIEGLEPLSFVLGRLMDALSSHLERRDRGAAVLHVRLHLVSRELHARTLQLPTPIRDARTLRTLALLDLESHPPSAAIDRVVVAVDPTPARVLQFSLLARPLPSPEQVSTLLARLGALMGTDRCGSPMGTDSWRPGEFGMKCFAPEPMGRVGRVSRVGNDPPPLAPIRSLASLAPVVAFRRFRMPIAARARVQNGQPVYLTTGRRGLSSGPVTTCSGPWRTSGAWWAHSPQSDHSPNSPPWDRDEWDIALRDGTAYRIFRDCLTNGWFLEGTFD